MTTCPSGVDYMHLAERGRAHVEATYRRPAAESWLRRLLVAVLPHPHRFRLALTGTYSITQPDLSDQLRDRKAAHLAATGAEVVASGNIGCIEHLRNASPLPMLHMVQLLDWASGGPRLRGL